jgi:hypothetical protein
VCFVLVDAAGGHAFCSRYDFGPWPLLEGVERLPAHVMRVGGRVGCLGGGVGGAVVCEAARLMSRCRSRLHKLRANKPATLHKTKPRQALTTTRAVCFNGFVFDELPLELVRGAVEAASGAGAAIFFDPGGAPFGSWDEGFEERPQLL